MSDTPDPLIGHEIGGRYRIVSRLGAGGMATAYLATDTRVRRDVVVKIPHTELLAQPGFRERFQREIRSLTELQHPGIVPLYDCGEEPGGVPWCVVRYLPGGDLADRMERGGTIAAVEIAQWLPRVAEALDFIHAAGVLHRDVTPSNILFDQSGNGFVSDFGVAAILRATDDTAVTEDPRLTAEGAFVGAAVYAPPEAVSRDLRPAYDQYSLALVLYQALCGYLPYAQIENRALMIAKNSDPPAPLDQRGVPIPPTAVAAVMRGLALEPEARFASCRELADAFAASDDAISTQEILLPRTTRAATGSGRWIGLAAVATVVLAVAAWMLLGPGRDEGSTPSADTASKTAPPAGDRVIAGVFLAGTTDEELDAALRLCRKHADCPRSLYDDEDPREVQIAPYRLDRGEVTNRDFAAFVEATGYETTAELRGTSRDGPFEERGLDWRQPAGPRSSWEDLVDHPVVHVSALDAETYCAHHDQRLPTEDEWEMAARGNARLIYPWGDTWDDEAANWAVGSSARLRPGGRFPRGPYGHVDLVGNVWEWTATHRGAERVLKGGSFMETNPADLRAAARLVTDPNDRSSDIGFRCARDVAQ